jgi:hypothetical protein
VGRTGGTFLHTSRIRPSHVASSSVPERGRHTELWCPLVQGRG